MATLTQRGKAAVTGVPGTFDVILYPVQQTIKADHDFELETVKDVNGQDAAWIGRNEHANGTFACKLLGDTQAHAAVGAAFLAPLAVVTLSTFTSAFFNTTWCVINGSDIDLANTKVGDITFKLRRYVDATQNTLFATTPT